MKSKKARLQSEPATKLEETKDTTNKMRLVSLRKKLKKKDYSHKSDKNDKKH